MNNSIKKAIAVGDGLFLGMQDFDFAQIQSNLSKSNHFCLNFASILPKFHLMQFHPNLTNFAQKILLENSSTFAASSAPTTLKKTKI